MSDYLDRQSHAEIRRRATVAAEPVDRLEHLQVEVACARLRFGLSKVFVVTPRISEIIHTEIGRAIAHADIAYPDPRLMLGRVYDSWARDEPYMPTLVTGPAGTGKTQLELAIGRVLEGVDEVRHDQSHNFPSRLHASVTVKGQASVGRALRSLACPDVASGLKKVPESEMARECSRWLYANGTCLFGVDELQFLTQSADASVLVTRVLLAFLEIKVPWRFTANYSLCWRLLGRPSEVRQRLLGNPVVLLPEEPESGAWHSVISEYQTVGRHALSFDLTAKSVELWALSAGLKRELVKLLVHGYRLARLSGRFKISWNDIEQAYGSTEFYASRTDIELMIRYAGTGGELRQDLLCPFKGDSISVPFERYQDSLRRTRVSGVAHSVQDAAMTVAERNILEQARACSEPESQKIVPHIIKVPRKKPTLDTLQDAAKRFRVPAKPEKSSL